MNPSPPADVVKQLKEATGLGWMEAKRFLLEQDTELCQRILRAGREQLPRPTYARLHDPIEDDPEFKDQISAAKAEAEANYKIWLHQTREGRLAGPLFQEWPRGSCYRIWKETKDSLQKQGIRWFSPAEMNPAYCFD